MKGKTVGERDRLLRQVLDSLPVGVAVVDQASDIQLVNPASGRIWGGVIHTGDDRYAKSMGVWRNTGVPVATHEWGSMRALRHGETSLNELIDIETFDGRRRTIQNSAAPIRDGKNRIIGAVIVNEDVTERVQAEEALRKSERVLREAESLGRTGSWEWDVTSGEVQASEQNRRLFFGDDTSKGSRLEDYVAVYHPDDRERVMASTARALAEDRWESEIEFRIIRRDGSVCLILGRLEPVRDTQGKVVRAHGTNTDITERRLAEEELARRSREEAAIAQLSLSALSSEALEPLFDEAVALIANVLGVEIVLVLEGDPDGGELTLRANHEPLHEPAARHRSMANATDFLAGRDVKRSIVAPIPGKERPFGVVGAHTTKARRFFLDEVNFVWSIANVLATAIEQKRTLQALDEKGERLRSLSRRLLDAQEAERRAVARELHDDFGAVLTAIKLNLQRKSLSAPAVRAETIALVDQAIQQVRDLALDLRPAILDDLGLVEALRWYAEREAKRAGLVLELDLEDVDPRLPLGVVTACFRLVQEALTNIVRHSGARTVCVELRAGSDELRVEVRDDGRGFDVVAARKAAASGKSQGLLNMQERAEFGGGRFSIDSAPGRGAIVRAVLPAIPEEPR